MLRAGNVASSTDEEKAKRYTSESHQMSNVLLLSFRLSSGLKFVFSQFVKVLYPDLLWEFSCVNKASPDPHKTQHNLLYQPKQYIVSLSAGFWVVCWACRLPFVFYFDSFYSLISLTALKTANSKPTNKILCIFVFFFSLLTLWGVCVCVHSGRHLVNNGKFYRCYL